MIEYRDSAEGVTPSQLQGFFEGWPSPPSPETHLALLHGSAVVVLALDTESGAVIGFATGITDGVLAAYIPLLEVLPSYRGRGIGKALIERITERFRNLYMVDVVCDADVLPFYERLGFHPGASAILRRRDNLPGEDLAAR